MTLDEKVGQLFMVATFSNKSEQEYAYIERMVRERHLGGLIFMQGTANQQALLVNRYQRAARVPLLIGQDAEWGLDMRLDDTPRFPKNMTLGAIEDDSLLYDMGAQIAEHLRRVGVTINFAPVVDVNNNPNNPVINYRSFGENKHNVARKGIMLSKGLQDNGVMACAKHFPGHGDTDTDSHHDLPILTHSSERLDTLELYPFVKLSQAGVQAAMVAHLYIPSIDPTPNQATTLSPLVVKELLREKIGFEGLIFTDALNMQGVAKYYPNGEAAYRAFLAGNDVLLFPENIPRAISLIKEAVEDGRIEQRDLDERVMRILKAKYSVGLDHYLPLSVAGISASLNTSRSQVLIKKLYEASTTLAKNQNDLIPLDRLPQRKIAYVQIGGRSNNSFDVTLKKYAQVSNFYLRPGFTKGEKEQMIRRLEGYDTIIIGVFGMNSKAKKRFGISQTCSDFSRELEQAGHETILTLFGSPYALQYFGEEDAIIVAYESVSFAQNAAAQAIFGGQPVTGLLPITASEQFPEGGGVQIGRTSRFGFGLPEEQGMSRYRLRKIDSIAQHHIERRAMPGCAVMVMKGDQVVYAKGFGHMTYDPRSTHIEPYYHLYDLASVTKVAATTLAAMKLVEQGKLDLDKPIFHYLPEFKGTNKAYLTARNLLLHNSGLPGWITPHHETYSDFARKILNPRYYASGTTRGQDLSAVGPGLYGTEALGDLMDLRIKQAKLRRRGRTRYSDVGLMIMGKIIESISGYSLDRFVAGSFYRPMGMDRTGFNPHKVKLSAACPPTEEDEVWRKTTVQGYVHDPAAACLGGVAGHAGLFSNVYDLGKLLLMLKNGGVYGDRRYLKEETIRSFTRKQQRYGRRGLGWDKPEGDGSNPNPVSNYASAEAYGHAGFTGTCIWVDPAYDLVFVFLSNRTYPNLANRGLQQQHVREKIMDQVYLSIKGFQLNGKGTNTP